MNFFKFITQDFGDSLIPDKGKIICFLFRIGNYANDSRLKFLFMPYIIWYKIFVEWILGVEIRYNTSIGPGLTIYHFQAIVINTDVVIGKNLSIRNSTTIGNKGVGTKSPTIGDNVDIGSNVCIIGPISVGNNVTIGAGSVVVKDIPSNCIVAGNPARIIKYKSIG